VGDPVSEVVDRIAAAIRREIDEDERLARAAAHWAGGSTWRASTAGNVYGTEEMANNPIAVGPWDTDLYEVAEHIARQDPDRTLRRVAAHRKILDLHAAGTHECRDATPSVYPADAHLLGRTPGEEWIYYSTEYFESRPCPTLLALADVYGVQ